MYIYGFYIGIVYWYLASTSMKFHCSFTTFLQIVFFPLYLGYCAAVLIVFETPLPL